MRIKAKITSMDVGQVVQNLYFLGFDKVDTEYIADENGNEYIQVVAFTEEWEIESNNKQVGFKDKQ